MERALPLTNEARDAHTHFRIGPDAVLAAEAEAKRRGLEVVGFYHSHPSGAAEPSAADAEQAWPWYTYLIVGADGALRAWRLRADRGGFDAQALDAEPEA